MTLSFSIRRAARTTALFAVALFTSGCTVKYSFSGASIDPAIKTVSIARFNNMAAMVAPILSPTIYDMFSTKISRETRLQIVNNPDDADLTFSGEIIDYRSDPAAISSNEYAVMNRLTIVVKIRFVNNVQPKFSYDKVYSRYADYDSQVLLSDAERSLIPEIVTQIVDDAFNDAFSGW